MRRKPPLSRNPRLRFFVALTPNPETQKRIMEKVSELKTRYPRLRWEKPEHWHITLAYFGSLSSQQQTMLKQQLARLAEKTPTIHVKGVEIEQFPPFGRPVVLAWKIAKTPFIERVAYLSERFLSDVDHTGGLQIFNFRPHLSIARAHEAELKKFAAETAAVEFDADSVDLYSSSTLMGSTKYQILHRYPLRHDES